MLYADLRYDYVRTWPMPVADLPFDQAERLFGDMEDEGRSAIAAAMLGTRKIVIARAADMRYVGQEHAVTVELPMRLFTKRDTGGIKRAFDEVHLRRYGTSAPDENAQIVSLRSTITGILDKPPIDQIGRGQAAPPRTATRGRRKVYMGAAAKSRPACSTATRSGPATKSTDRRWLRSRPRPPWFGPATA